MGKRIFKLALLHRVLLFCRFSTVRRKTTGVDGVRCGSRK
nr:MAG TPA: hypothetical protein [Caudoviricetes sp.]